MVFSLVRPPAGHPRAYADGLAAGLVMMSILSNAFQNSSSSLVIAKVQGNAVDFLMPPLSALKAHHRIHRRRAARGLLVGAASLIAVAWLANIMPVNIFVALYYAIVASVIFGFIGLHRRHLGRQIRSPCRGDELHHRAAHVPLRHILLTFILPETGSAPSRIIIRCSR